MNHRHTKNIVELNIFPTSPRNDSPKNYRSLRTEKTDHHTSQPMKMKAKNNDYINRQRNQCSNLTNHIGLPIIHTKTYIHNKDKR